MLRHILKFSLLLILVSGLSYAVHRFVLLDLLQIDAVDFLNFYYKFNIGITFLFTSTIILGSKKLKDQIGFIFLVGSFIKLGLFLYLNNRLDFATDKTLLVHFFVPYACCLIVEIFYINKLLTNINHLINK